ncbi:hypothetical protein ABEB36_006970 [Hypothenemus hampei]|uniref:Phospholipase A2 n=1 Tax=Hypothenemus hampei TaxID=57062 RepID=A0ABD1ET50_HYPHA
MKRRAHDLIKTIQLILLFGTTLASNVLISDSSMSKMIEFSSKEPYCTLHSDRGTIRTKLLASDTSRVRQMSNSAIKTLETVCANKEDLTRQNGGFMYPGTKWCGPGNTAADYNDLGYFMKEDSCCRQHDHCPKSLAKNECREGICNNSPFTRSHCDCDATFRKCLQNVNSETANTIGAIFFNIVQVICFRERSPCSEWQKNGYTKAESDKICARWNFRPSEKYFPLMPVTTN